MSDARVLALFRAAIGTIAILKGTALASAGVEPLILVGWFAAAVPVAVGFRARWFAGGLAVIAGSLLVSGFYRNHLYLLALLLVLVVVSACERELALRPRGEGPAPAWPLGLMRWQLSIVYGYAALAKINADFLSGGALAHRFDASILPVPDFGRFLVPLAVLVVAVELFVAFAPWVDALRRWALAAAVFMHAGMLLVADSWTMALELVLFAGMMFALFAAFFTQGAAAPLTAAPTTPAGAPPGTPPPSSGFPRPRTGG